MSFKRLGSRQSHRARHNAAINTSQTGETADKNSSTARLDCRWRRPRRTIKLYMVLRLLVLLVRRAIIELEPTRVAVEIAVDGRWKPGPSRRLPAALDTIAPRIVFQHGYPFSTSAIASATASRP